MLDVFSFDACLRYCNGDVYIFLDGLNFDKAYKFTLYK